MKTICSSFVFGALLLAATSVSAQDATVSEDDARCFIDGICSIEAEKKFSIANISTEKKVAPAATAASKPVVTGLTPARNRRPVQVASAGTRPSRPAATASRQSLDMRLSFELNSAQLTPEAMKQADVFAKVLKESVSNTGSFLIEGHTDSIGSSTSNLDLSRRRAESVVSYLVGQGVSPAKLKAVGYGYKRPRDGTTAADPTNRRVEIVRLASSS